MKRVILCACVVVAMVMGFSVPAHAIPIISLTTDDVTYTVITDGGVGDTFLGPGLTDGVVGFSGTIGGFSVAVSFGTSIPATGTPAFPQMDLTAVVVGAGTMKIRFTDTAFLAPTFPDFHSAVGASFMTPFFGPLTHSVTYNTYHDPANAPFGGSGLTPAGTFPGPPVPGPTLMSIGPFGGVSAFSSFANAPAPAGGPYSLTQELIISHTIAGQMSSVDAHITATPEPGTVLLLGFGLVGLGLYGRRRKTRSSC